MSIKNLIIYVVIGLSNLMFSSINTREEIRITQYMGGGPHVRYDAQLNDKTKISCTRITDKKPECTYTETVQTGNAWKKEDQKKKYANWQNWFILKELFEYTEKQAQEDMKKFEKEFAEMKNSAQSESDFFQDLKSKLIADL